jgi:hypothetical protein
MPFTSINVSWTFRFPCRILSNLKGNISSRHKMYVVCKAQVFFQNQSNVCYERNSFLRDHMCFSSHRVIKSNRIPDHTTSSPRDLYMNMDAVGDIIFKQRAFLSPSLFMEERNPGGNSASLNPWKRHKTESCSLHNQINGWK